MKRIVCLLLFAWLFTLPVRGASLADYREKL